MSAASQVRRLQPDMQITVYEKEIQKAKDYMDARAAGNDYKNYDKRRRTDVMEMDDFCGKVGEIAVSKFMLGVAGSFSRLIVVFCYL